MAESRGKPNGERKNPSAAEENSPMSSRRGSLQPETRHRVNGGGESCDGRGFDLQNLESSFGKLSFSDSTPFRQQIRLPDNRWTNRSPSISNGGGEYLFPPAPPREQIQRLSYDRVNGGPIGYYNPSSGLVMPNNGGGFDSRDVSYSPMNRFYEQSSLDSTDGGYDPRIVNNPWRSHSHYYNPYHTSDPSSSMGNYPFVWLAKDQKASQKLQDQILEGSKETIDMIFSKVIFHVCDLMTDHFGSQVIHKLMEKSSSQQIDQILVMVTQNQHRFINICNDPLGTRVIQLLLKCLHTEDQIFRIVEEISKVALTLTRNNHANHVILQCFRHFTPLQNRSLMVIIARHCNHLAIDQFGCCMLQECLKIGCNELKQRLVVEIISNALRLCVNSYGNYVVQYVVELGDLDVTEQLIRILDGNYPYLSRNKYGSHCVQKLLKVKGIDSRLIVNDLLKDIDTLLLDPYGNYVIQTALVVSQGDMRQMLLLHIERNIRYMRCNMFGNKILEKLQLCMHEL